MSQHRIAQTPRAVPPRRQFDTEQPFSAARNDYPDSEDPALTAYLERIL